MKRHYLYRNFLIWLSALAFLLYAAGVLALHQDRTADWILETAFAIPAAISHLDYGTPIGAMDSNVRSTFWRFKAEMPLDAAIKKVASGSLPKDTLEPLGADGIGAGTALFATFSMWLFGMHMSSLVYFYLGIVGISAAAFIVRFRDARLLSVPLIFFGLSLLLLTPLSLTPELAGQAPIGGNRLFSLAAILPTLHIWFEVLDPAPGAVRWARYTLVFVQAVVLFAVLLVRSSAMLLLLPIIGAMIWYLVRRRMVARTIGYASCVAAAWLLWASVVATTMPGYVESGRVMGNVWHRAFASFFWHPKWPFGNLTEMYDCAWVRPQGLEIGPDSAAQCVWFSQPFIRNFPSSPLVLQLYGREYETVLRKAFFDVVSSYPKETLELFGVKAQLVGNTMVAALTDIIHLPATTASRPVFWIVAVQAAIFTVFSVISLMSGSLIGRWLAVFPALYLLSLMPLFIAWANRTTSADAVLLLYLNLSLLLLLCIQCALRAIRAGRPALFNRSPLSRSMDSPAIPPSAGS